jgi:hypothetical protein
MSEPRGMWQAGRILDEVPPPRRPVAFVLAVLAGLLLVDLLLAAALAARPEPLDVSLHDDDDARHVLERATLASEPWLLVGDSVLAGDVMEGRVPGWQEERVIDHMRRQLPPDSRVTLHQIALNGLLPVDMLRIVTELDRVDPGARVSVVLELNPRYASAHYAEQKACTREWLCDLGVPLFAGGRIDWATWASSSGHGLVRWALDRLPVARHRRALGLSRDLAAVPGLAEPLGSETGPGVLEGRARLAEHYRDPVLDDRSAQMRALVETVDRLRDSGRRAVFFVTPVEDGFLRSARGPDDRGELVAHWSGLVDTPERANVELVNLDHPSFTTPLFLDHCHMGPEGNRRLALNLLHELGLGLSHAPDRTEVVHAEGPDDTLVARIARGDSDGPGWQAAFDRPVGIAVTPGSGRVVVADTSNHCLRELRGNLQTVRTIAGACGQRGKTDGPPAKSRLDGPRHPWFLGEDVWFTTNKGTRLRRLSAGHVSTTYRLSGERWRKIERIRGFGRHLYLLDSGRRVLRLDLHTHHVDIVAKANHGRRIRAFDVTPDGRIFLVDHEGRILQASTSATATLGDTTEGAEVVFENTAATVLPEAIGAFYPFAFDELRLSNVRDVQWVERYDGLLVADDVPLRPRKDRKYVTERIHLRFFSLADRLVYPWVKPLAFGGGHIVKNVSTDSFVTDFHDGSMALDQATGSLFWLELRRSRLIRMGDGLLGAALTGNVPSRRIFNETREFFGAASGEATFARFRPDRHLARRWERLPRKGPYLGVMFGSSMIGASDNVGMYSMARRFERILQEELGYRDRTRFDLMVRSYAGATLSRLADVVEEHVEVGLLPDVIFVEFRSTRKFFRGHRTDEAALAAFDRIRAAADRVGALLVVLDNTAMVGRKRDALREGSTRTLRRMQMIRDTGVLWLDPGDLMLEDHLRVSPWASPPFGNHHASPWGVDATAERYAGLAYPLLRELFDGRTPSRLRGEIEPTVARAPLGPVLDGIDADWDALLLPVNPGTMQRQYSRGHLELFVDIASLDLPASASEAELERAALSCVRAALERDPASRSAEQVTIRLARFSNYDEYGQGVLRGADVRLERTLDAEGLLALATAVAGRAEAP